jgi:hypothetical protein
MNRIIFLILGFFRFDCQNFGYFNREYFILKFFSTPKITLKSGYIGMGTHKNIIDFLYYSYLFNPVFVKLILIVNK